MPRPRRNGHRRDPFPRALRARRIPTEQLQPRTARRGADDVPACRVCGCTDDTPCPGGCFWVSDPQMGDLCSTCTSKEDQTCTS